MNDNNVAEYFRPVLNAAAQSPARVLVDLNALENNFRYLSNRSDMPLMPVIKADAYGHGLLPCAKRLAAAGAEWFAVGTVAEGVLLRESGFGQKTVSLLGCLCPEDIELAAAHNIIPFVGSFEQLDALTARVGGQPVSIALKFNTGMNRLGFSPDELGELIRRLSVYPKITPVLAASHLASADEDGGVEQTNAQIQTFEIIMRELRRDYPEIGSSLYNTAGLLAHSHKLATTLARPGLALYGSNPLGGTALNQPEIDSALRPVMQVWAPVVQKRLLRRGEKLSYGGAFTAPEDMQAAIVAVGYSQGFSRGLSGRGELNIHGVRCPVLGRVCMQLVAVDAGGLESVSEGDQAWILGGPGNSPIRAEELAAWWGTIPYEVFCLLGGVNSRECR
ncbi:MAG: alanine racemase [Desulfovibrionaceae bacterium]|nr:alanine racemase [Desulfovibrionaceae bacterium]